MPRNRKPNLIIPSSLFLLALIFILMVWASSEQQGRNVNSPSFSESPAEETEETIVLQKVQRVFALAEEYKKVWEEECKYHTDGEIGYPHPGRESEAQLAEVRAFWLHTQLVHAYYNLNESEKRAFLNLADTPDKPLEFVRNFYRFESYESQRELFESHVHPDFYQETDYMGAYDLDFDIERQKMEAHLKEKKILYFPIPN